MSGSLSSSRTRRSISMSSPLHEEVGLLALLPRQIAHDLGRAPRRYEQGSRSTFWCPRGACRRWPRERARPDAMDPASLRSEFSRDLVYSISDSSSSEPRLRRFPVRAAPTGLAHALPGSRWPGPGEGAKLGGALRAAILAPTSSSASSRIGAELLRGDAHSIRRDLAPGPGVQVDRRYGGPGLCRGLG